MLVYAIEDLVEAGISEIGLVLGNKGREEIQKCVGDGSKFGAEITYIVQGDPLGIAHAVGCAREFVGEDDFVVYLGDNLLEQRILEPVQRFERNEHAASVFLKRVNSPEEFGIAELDGNGNIKNLVEKPDTPPSDLAIVGVYLFSSDVFDAIERLEPSWRGELELTDAIQSLLDDGKTVTPHIVDGWWKDIARPKDVLEANRLRLDLERSTISGERKKEVEADGGVDINENAVIEEGATVHNPVRIGANTTISGDAEIGPYTSIGSGSHIEDASIENSVLMDDVTVTTCERIVDSLIGNETVIGNVDARDSQGNRLVIGKKSTLSL